MRKKDEQTDIERIEKRLDNLQTTIETEINVLKEEIGTQVKDLHKSIEERTRDLKELSETIDRKSYLGVEDQLFFGFVFSLLILAITFPTTEDITTFFRNIGLGLGTALHVARSLKVGLICGLLASSFCRYYGFIKGKKRIGRFVIDLKFTSIELLIFCLCLLLLNVIISAYGSWVVEVNALLVFTSAGIAMLVFWYIGVLERKWISLYTKIGQIEQEYTENIWIPFFCVSMGIFITYIIVVVRAFLNALNIFYIPFNSYIFLALGLIISYLIMYYRSRRKKKKDLSSKL